MAFQKRTSAQRQQAKARIKETRSRSLERVKTSVERAAFCFVAYADGDLNDSEVEFLAQRFGDDLTFTAPTREALRRSLRAYLAGSSLTLVARQRLKRELMKCATCDGPLSDEEDEALLFIADILGLTAEKRAAKRRAWKRPSNSDKTSGARGSKQRKAYSKKPADEPPPATYWSYEYLGCSESDSDDTIKRRYRQLALKLHPDKHAAKAKSPEEMLHYTEAFQKLHAAYDEVWRLRGTVGRGKR